MVFTQSGWMFLKSLFPDEGPVGAAILGHVQIMNWFLSIVQRYVKNITFMTA